jgi:DTW domain-containing protein YfiP
MVSAVSVEHRAVCGTCRRPASVCYCRHITKVDTVTRIVLLQHPRERDTAIGTARMASLCLPNAELHVGVRWQGSAALARALSDPSRPAVLLYPGPGAIDVVRSPPPGPVTLIVVDGTWWQARKLVRSNPELAALPRYAFTPPSPSEYRIRKEPDATYVSTIEALVHVLGALEGDPTRFRALLTPFRAMIDAQIEHERTRNRMRIRHKKKTPKPPGVRVPAILRERADDLVCVVGEANAWPYRAREEGTTYEDELVHWVAVRVATGEVFEEVVAPTSPLAPRASSHVRLPVETIAGGGTLPALHARWRAFVRESDVVCSWGRYATSLFVSRGGHLPPARVDLRQVARAFTRGKVGTLEDLMARLELPAAPDLTQGRAGMRLAQVSLVAATMRDLAIEAREGD